MVHVRGVSPRQSGVFIVPSTLLSRIHHVIKSKQTATPKRISSVSWLPHSINPAHLVYVSTNLGRSKPTLTMAKYTPIDMVDHYRGKICSHSDTYFQKRGDTLCTGRICNPRDLSKKPYSPEEIATHQKFSSVIAAIKALTSEQRSAYETAFAIHLKSPHPKYQTLAGFIFAKEYEKLGN